MKPKKALLIASVLLTLLGAFTFIALCRYQPALPEHWQKIHRGQPRSEVLQLVPELMTDLYVAKGCDQANYFSQSPVFGQVSQYLMVLYGPDDRVTLILVGTVTTRFQLLRQGGHVSRNA